MYEIRLCKRSEINKLQEFIDNQWKKGHILATDIKLLEWQHLNKQEDDTLNFVVAFDLITNNFKAILGFIPLNHFDSELLREDFWLAIWKVEKDNSQPGLGLQLLEYLIERYKPKSIGSIGINIRVKKVYDLLKFKTVQTTQYYIINSQKETFNIAKVGSTLSEPDLIKSTFKINEVSNLESLHNLKHVYRPTKSLNFLINRYQKHPVYNYLFYAISQHNKVFALFILRKIVVNNSSCLRIVDIFGDLHSITSIKSELIRLACQLDVEYIDCVNSGIEEETFVKLGFNKRLNEPVIPNYFEPFEQRNIDILCAIKSEYDPYIIFKGDSDQDRPNSIK